MTYVILIQLLNRVARYGPLVSAKSKGILQRPTEPSKNLSICVISELQLTARKRHLLLYPQAHSLPANARRPRHSTFLDHMWCITYYGMHSSRTHHIYIHLFVIHIKGPLPLSPLVIRTRQLVNLMLVS